MKRSITLILILLLLSPLFVEAKVETVYATHKYVLGNNDSKNDARRMCFLEVKRKLLEKAGIFIQSHTKVTDFELTKDEISTYAFALLKVDISEENWKFVGENFAK